MEERKCCGSCKYNRIQDREFYCGNQESENFGYPTEFCDSCGDYEKKEN